MKVIVGLGNPEKKYDNTYHNIGFDFLDYFAEKNNYIFTKTKCHAKVAEEYFGDQKIMLVKPQTYMNLSGVSVSEIVRKFKVNLKDLIVIFDDIDINKGEAKFKLNGSGGTHNGMRNIVEMLGSTDFARIKIGTKPENKPYNLVDYVLSKTDNGEWKDTAFSIAEKKLADFLNGKC